MLTELSTYIRDPIGLTTGTAQFFVWFPTPELRVIAAWGTLMPSGAEAILRAATIELAPDFQPHCSIIDMRGMRPLAHETINAFLDAGIPRLAEWQRVIISSALVHNGGVSGMAAGAIAGYTAHSPHPIDVHIHDTVQSAVRRLPVSLDPDVIAEGIELRRAYVEERSMFMRSVRAWIALNLRDASIARCARALGMAPRTLQRRLADANATFREELQRERVARAKHLLAESDLKVAAIADEVGFPKIQSLADPFRRETGMGPAEWRARA